MVMVKIDLGLKVRKNDKWWANNMTGGNKNIESVSDNNSSLKNKQEK